jgi:hypothetical protein
MPTIIYMYQKISHNKKQTRVGWLVDEDSNTGVAFFIYKEEGKYVSGKAIPAEKYMKEMRALLKTLGISTEEHDVKEYVLGENKVIALKDVHTVLSQISKKKIPTQGRNSILEDLKMVESAEISMYTTHDDPRETFEENHGVTKEEKISPPSSSILAKASPQDLKFIFSEITKQFSHWDQPKIQSPEKPGDPILSKEQIGILFTVNQNPKNLDLLFNKLKISTLSKLRTLIRNEIVAVAYTNTSFPYALTDCFIEMVSGKLNSLLIEQNHSVNLDPKRIFEAIDSATEEWKELITSKTKRLANMSGFFGQSKSENPEYKSEAAVNWHNQIKYLPQIIEQTKYIMAKTKDPYQPVSTTRIPVTSTLFFKKKPAPNPENSAVIASSKILAMSRR